MWKRINDAGRAAASQAQSSTTAGVIVKLVVCIAGGTLGWALARL